MCEFTRLRDLAVVVRRQNGSDVVSSVIAGDTDLNRASAPSVSLLDRFREIWESASAEEREASGLAIGEMVGLKAVSQKSAGVLFPDAVEPPAGRTVPTDAEFESFWKAFPRRTKKPDAKKAFIKAFIRLRKTMGSEQAIDTIMNGVSVYAKNANPDVLCHPSTWLNADRWDDDPAGIGNRDKASRSADNAMLGAYEERERTPLSEAVF